MAAYSHACHTTFCIAGVAIRCNGQAEGERIELSPPFRAGHFSKVVRRTNIQLPSSFVTYISSPQTSSPPAHHAAKRFATHFSSATYKTRILSQARQVGVEPTLKQLWRLSSIRWISGVCYLPMTEIFPVFSNTAILTLSTPACPSALNAEFNSWCVRHASFIARRSTCPL